jgi:hypothetical protein
LEKVRRAKEFHRAIIVARTSDRFKIAIDQLVEREVSRQAWWVSKHDF